MAWRKVVLAALWCLGPACAALGSAQPAGDLAVRVLYGSGQCAGSGREAGSRVLPSGEELAGFFSGLSRTFVGSPPLAPPAVDLDRETVVVLSMGTRPTAGFGLGLASPGADQKGGRALVRIRWDEPAPGTMQAQVLTSPCLVVSLGKGSYSSAEFVDQLGVVRFRTDFR